MVRKWLFVGLAALMLGFSGCGHKAVSEEHSGISIPLLPSETEESQVALPETDATESSVTFPVPLPETDTTESQTIYPAPLPETDADEGQTVYPVPLPGADASEEFEQQDHSEYYIPGQDADTLVQYFCEVVLDAEYVNSGNATVVRKWDRKVIYFIHGEPTQGDMSHLESMVEWLCSIPGFPGMEETENEAEANLQIHFVDKQRLIELMGERHESNDGAVTYWYRENRIYKSIICYRTDIDQYVRNSVVREEIYNGMGPLQDTSLRKDSIIYSGFSAPQQLTDVDKLIMVLLYHPDIDYGMNAEECEEVIRQLYY